MVLARMKIWKFKPGRRDQGINVLYDTLTGLGRVHKGFLGSMSLLSQDDENTVITVSLWENEETRTDSEHLFKKAYEPLKESLTDFPEIKNSRVYSAELKVGLSQ